jgi:hypothetical protein
MVLSIAFWSFSESLPFGIVSLMVFFSFSAFAFLEGLPRFAAGEDEVSAERLALALVAEGGEDLLEF